MPGTIPTRQDPSYENISRLLERVRDELFAQLKVYKHICDVEASFKVTFGETMGELDSAQLSVSSKNF